MFNITNLSTDEMIQELAKRVSSGKITVTKISADISKIVKFEKESTDSKYQKIMREKIKKFGYMEKYDLKRTLGFFETIHDNNFKTVDEFIDEVTKKNEITSVSLKYSLFDNNMRQYSALRECLFKYLRKIKNVVDASDYWTKLTKEEKLKCYIELEEYIYNL